MGEFYNRNGAGPYYTYEEGVIPDGEAVLATEVTGSGTTSGFDGDAVCGVRVSNGIVQVGMRTYSDGVMLNEAISWSNLYSLSDLERAYNPAYARHVKELSFVGGFLDQIVVYSNTAHTTILFIVDFTWSGGLMIMKEVSDMVNSVALQISYTYVAGIMTTKDMVVI